MQMAYFPRTGQLRPDRTVAVAFGAGTGMARDRTGRSAYSFDASSSSAGRPLSGRVTHRSQSGLASASGFAEMSA